MLESKLSPQITQIEIGNRAPLKPGVIQFYLVSISDLQAEENLLTSYLSQDEEIRAKRFINPQHGKNFRRVRGLLRQLLSLYLKVDPHLIEFCYSEYGKPMLKDYSTCYFNLSHSNDLATYVFSCDRAVGVDIEYMRPQRDLAGMIGHIGSEREQAELSGLVVADAHDSFYRLWTRKEAFIKAYGRGLGMGLRSIHVGTTKSESSVGVEYKNVQLPEWFIKDINPPAGYKLAICSTFKTI